MCTCKCIFFVLSMRNFRDMKKNEDISDGNIFGFIVIFSIHVMHAVIVLMVVKTLSFSPRKNWNTVMLLCACV